MKKSITTLDLNLLLCLQLLMQERSVTKAAKRMNVTPSSSRLDAPLPLMKKSITTLDLNLLLCLQLLMQERSVTKAAKRMNVTPSAVSKSLAKLRAWFDDPLFVNSPLGLSPTPLMVSMEQNLAEWMQMSNLLLDKPHHQTPRGLKFELAAESPLMMIPTPLMVSMEQNLAEWMQMSNLLLDKPHHQTPRGLKFELAAESPLMMIMLNALSKRIYQRYPQATIKLRNWDYDSLDAITRGEVDIGFSGRESHPRSRELLSSLPLAIDYEVLFSDVPCVWLRKDHPALHETWNLDTFLRYPHISICWEQSDTWALDNVLQELGRERTLLDKPHHQTPRGLKFELAAESPLMMIMLNALSRRIYQRYPQATIKLRNWDYDSLDDITRGAVDIGFSGRESHPRSRELLSSLPLANDYEVLVSYLTSVCLRKDHPALHETWNLDTFLRYPHISICWEQSDTWALDNVLQELGRERTIAMSLPEFEQSLFMAAQPDNLLLATAPRYCQYYNQLHQLPLVALPLPFDESQQKKLEVPFTLLWHKRNSHNPKIVWLRETIKNLYASMA